MGFAMSTGFVVTVAALTVSVAALGEAMALKLTTPLSLGLSA